MLPQEKEQQQKELSTNYYTGLATQTPLKKGVKSGALERLSVPAPLVTPAVLLSDNTNIIGYGNHGGHRHAKINTKGF